MVLLMKTVASFNFFFLFFSCISRSVKISFYRLRAMAYKNAGTAEEIIHLSEHPSGFSITLHFSVVQLNTISNNMPCHYYLLSPFQSILILLCSLSLIHFYSVKTDMD